MKKKVGKALDKVLESLDPLPPQRTPPSTSSPPSVLNKSTDSNIFNTLSDMDSLLSSTVNNTKGPGSGGTLDQRLDHILAILMETKAICERNEKEIVALKEKIISLEKENNTVKRELRVAKESTNRYELASRLQGLQGYANSGVKAGKRIAFRFPSAFSILFTPPPPHGRLRQPPAN
jgi:hypothetical protein